MVIPLGTREVEAYVPPPWQFDKVLYIEKEGLEAQLAPYRLGQRYDMAIIFGKGYAATACRNLLARSDIRDMKIFVLHDADLGGYNIARTLAEATRRMPNHSVDVIDLGLTVPQAIEFGLETENFTRRRSCRPIWNSTRLRSNGSPANRYKPGTASVTTSAGVANSTRSPATSSPSSSRPVCNGTARPRNSCLLRMCWPCMRVWSATWRSPRLVERELKRMVDIDQVVRQLVAGHPGLADINEAGVRDTFTGNPTQSWRSSSEQLVRENIDAVDGLADAVRAQLAEQLAASMNDDDGETGERP